MLTKWRCGDVTLRARSCPRWSEADIMFLPQTAAEIAAVFVRREGGTIATLKLVKLIYLADRLSMDRYRGPITYDDFVSMPHGPVPSNTYDLIKGEVRDPAWSRWITPPRDHHVSLAREDFNHEDLKRLSEADLQVLDDTWTTFGHMDQWEIRDHTHQHCAEWEDPGHSSAPIPEERIFRALGRDAGEAREAQEAIREHRYVARMLSGRQ